MQIDPQVLRAIAVTAELTGTQLSEAAVRVFAADLTAYPTTAVLQALERCRREVKGRLTIAEVVARVTANDGRPGIEEAWALVPKLERDSAVITDEMATAFGAARELIDAGDMIGARMAFKEVYLREVEQARAARRPVRWFPSLGHDAETRGPALRKAVELGRLTMMRAVELLPSLDTTAPDANGKARLSHIRAQVVARLEAPTKEPAHEEIPA